ncbi:DUF2269 domain-containing protein [Streptomyces sp. NPDC005805]|uniref:DUF2269 family protein n=1 Tax=Streptomyces sp. NPDC005805 TaxID=3157068 RepID=UPI0033C719C9
MKPLKRSVRRTVLVVHVTASGGWLGLTLGLLALALTAATTRSPGAVEASYRSMAVFTDWLVLPVALLTLLSGLVLSLGTHWGLARHRWVFLKFWLTLATTVASVLLLRPRVGEAAAAVAEGSPAGDPAGLVTGPAVSLSAYLFMTAVSVLKPWGLTRRGRRLRTAGRRPPADTPGKDAESHKGLDGRSPRPTA